MSNGLKDKHAVVTGAGQGIGAAIADALAGTGARLTLMGRTRELLERKAADLDAAQAVPVDVTDPNRVAGAFASARERSGPVDVLINNAGAAEARPYLKMSDDDWHAALAVNLSGVHYCTHAVLPQMLERGWGRIINIASTAAQKGYAYVSAYTAAKHGVLGLTRALALEFARSGVTFNAVCPGYTDTDVIRRAVENIVAATGRSEEEALAELTRVNPQGRLIQPVEVANAVVWLCREDSSSITGQALSVAGGEVM